MAEISAIVPVYKTEPYLCRCVDSLLIQTFEDFELILIDDGSPDGCGEICDAYARRDRRVHVIHQENGGLSAARNAGLDWAFANSGSRWVTFVDSDDWVHPKYLEALLGAARQYDVEVAICGFVRTSGEPLPEETPCAAAVWTPEAYYSRNAVNATVSWGKLYGKSCFQGLRFPVGKIHEDEFTTYRILFQLEHVAVVESALYAYFQNDSGIMRGKWTPRRLDGLEAQEEQIAYFSRAGMIDIAKGRLILLAYNRRKNLEQIRQCDALSEGEKRRYIRGMDRRLRRVLLHGRRYGLLPWNSERNKRIYMEVFPTVRVARNLWGRIKPVMKAVPGMRFLGEKAKRAMLWKGDIARVVRYVRGIRGKQAILLQSPLHGNLGDHAIALAELELLGAAGITCVDFPWSEGIEKLCARFTPAGKTILIHGGGYMGQLWPREEVRIRATLKAFRRNPVVIFPQTAYFDLATEDGRRCYEESRAIYEAHPRLTIFLRERYSLEFMRQYMPKVRAELVPDVVMLFHAPPGPEKREGVLLCLRADKERTMTDETRQRLTELLEESRCSVKCTDTVLRRNIDCGNRTRLVNEKMAEFAASRFVITDRLHGMIFAAITQTPCIVLDSLSPKLRGCYEWLDELDYIRFANDVSEVPSLMRQMEGVRPLYDRTRIEKAMAPLMAALRQSVGQK